MVYHLWTVLVKVFKFIVVNTAAIIISILSFSIIYIKGCKQYHIQFYISSMYKNIFSFSIFQEIKYTVSGIRNNKLTNFNSTNLILKEKNEL